MTISSNLPPRKAADQLFRALDPRLVWLARAAAKHQLVEAGEIGLDEAFDETVTALVAIVPGALTVDQIVARWERLYPYRGPR